VPSARLIALGLLFPAYKVKAFRTAHQDPAHRCCSSAPPEQARELGETEAHKEIHWSRLPTSTLLLGRGLSAAGLSVKWCQVPANYS